MKTGIQAFDLGAGIGIGGGLAGYKRRRRFRGIGDPSTDPYDTSYDPTSNPTENETVDPTTGQAVSSSDSSSFFSNLLSNITALANTAGGVVSTINQVNKAPGTPTVPGTNTSTTKTLVQQASSLSTGAKIGIGVGALLLIGGIVYAVGKK